MKALQSDSFVQGMVSIVITTYNRAPFIRECVDSALAQDYSSFEVIIVDDGSTDETRQICERYGDRVRYFWKPNGGAASAKNFGIMKMKGEWLKVLDSDDAVERDALTTFMKWAEKLRSEWLFCDCLEVDSNGRLFRTRSPKSRLVGDDLVRALWSKWNPSLRRRLPFSYSALSGTGFVRRSLLFRIGLLDERLAVFEDWEWALRAALVHGCFGAYIPLPLYRYRRHPGQLTAWTWEMQREYELRARMVVKSRMAGLAEGSKLLGYYRKDARSLRRTYRPLIALWGWVKSPSFQARAQFWGWTIAPSLMDRIFWGANPPL